MFLSTKHIILTRNSEIMQSGTRNFLLSPKGFNIMAPQEKKEHNKKQKPLYLLLISIHGLMRSHHLELGRDADTGGQIKYVADLARALSERPEIARVDIITRRTDDAKLSSDYAERIEPLSEKARIVRIDAGPEDYLPKETLWDHLDVFSDNLMTWLNTQPRLPDIVHSHYADSGYVGMRISNQLEIPFIHTSHSLGRDKRRRLLASGLSRAEVEQRYNINRRIDAEETVLANADLLIASTRNEIEEQYELYDYYQPERMAVIPPGTDLLQFHPPDANAQQTAFFSKITPFLSHPDKPIILALSRPDERKNIASLIEAYGQSLPLQKMANLVIVAGNREDIRDMDSGPQSVLTEILLLIDVHNLYGHVALPKQHLPEEVAEIYRLAAASQGVFVNPALTEPFGLTLLEAAASGLPIVATENGGPVDIIQNCKNGLLIDPLNPHAIAEALLTLLKDSFYWQTCAKNGLEGVRKHYAWQTHATSYLAKIKILLDKQSPHPHPRPDRRRRPMRDHHRAIFTPLDLSLIDSPTGLEDFIAVLRAHKKSTSFGVATGRRLDTAIAIMKQHGIPIPNVLITSLGTEIHYSPGLTKDAYWNQHIDHLWHPRAIRRLLGDLPGLKFQPKHEQSRFKISYYYDPALAPSVDEINTLLRSQEQTANVIHSFGQYLDIIPVRASKGQAIRYFAQHWEIPLERILVVGGSGADEDMMLGNTLAVVLANRHHEELSQLIDRERIYFASQPYAQGILEAITYYDFFKTCGVPTDDA